MHKTENVTQDLIILVLVILVILIPILMAYSISKQDPSTLEFHCRLIGGKWSLKSKGVYVCELPITD